GDRASKRARDQQLHDFVRAAIDALHTRVAIHAGDRIFIHITIAAEELQAFIDYPALQIGQPVFRHGGRSRIEATGKVAGHTIIVEYPADGDFGLEFRELELGVLEVDDL